MQEMTPAEKVAAYIKLRDHKKKADEEYKKGLERINLAMDKLEAELLRDLQANGVDSMKSDAGTVYIRIVASASVNDRDAFMNFLKDNDEWEALDVRANKVIVKEIMDRGQAVPGIKYSEVATVGVRRS